MSLAANRYIVADGPKAGRQGCVIVGCGRTFPDTGHTATICAKHWRLGDRRMRRLMRLIEARARRTGWNARLLAMHHRGFWKIVGQAQERSMGL